MRGKNRQARTVDIEKCHGNAIASLFCSHLLSKTERRLVSMVAVGDDELFIRHLLLNEFYRLGIRNNPDGVLYAILIVNLNVRLLLGDFIEPLIDSLFRVVVQHENLLELSARMTQQFQAVLFRAAESS